ncbi:MAG: C2H2-type zinc finger protein [Dehalococcoidales bacterium]|nr:C2H2-type zinc finger protein [Dehalococcoidales bacterium]
MVNKGVIVVGSLVVAGGLVFALTRKTEASTPPDEYCCPYCSMCFSTYEELVAHVQSAHPGERIPLPIEWE